MRSKAKTRRLRAAPEEGGAALDLTRRDEGDRWAISTQGAARPPAGRLWGLRDPRAPRLPARGDLSFLSGSQWSQNGWAACLAQKSCGFGPDGALARCLCRFSCEQPAPHPGPSHAAFKVRASQPRADGCRAHEMLPSSLCLLISVPGHRAKRWVPSRGEEGRARLQSQGKGNKHLPGRRHVQRPAE